MSKNTPYYAGEQCPNIERHDGGLHWAVGASNYQVTRADRFRPENCEGYGFTYNHAPDLTWFNGSFWLIYLGTPRDEHVAPGASFLCRSADGVSWSKPVEIFPPYRVPACAITNADGAEWVIADDTYAIMHQRMAFYQANGRLLALGFYGCPESFRQNPFNRRGIGRVVREIYPDGTFSPIYFIRYNRWAGWTEELLNYPMYTKSPDTGFVDACNALLSDPLAVQQWLDEHGDDDELIRLKGFGKLQAFNWYHTDEKTVIGLFKWSHVTRSTDNGESWEPPVYESSLVMSGAKIWGQKTPDGRYALVWTPNHNSNSRWPLAAATSDDGLKFDDLLCVHGEVPQARYRGLYKDCGPQYMRGISDHDQQPDDGCMWLTYSMNKEDIWVSRVPTPLAGIAEADADDDFAVWPASPVVEGWNVYSPLRCPVRVKKYGDRGYLELRDSDPADYGRAARFFKPRKRIRISTRVQVKAHGRSGMIWLELCDGKGQIAAGVCLDVEKGIRTLSGLEFHDGDGLRTGYWYELEFDVDCTSQRYELRINGESVGQKRFSYPVESVECAILRTGKRRTGPAMNAQLYDEEDYVNDTTAEADAEKHEVTVLVDYLRTAPGDPVPDERFPAAENDTDVVFE